MRRALVPLGLLALLLYGAGAHAWRAPNHHRMVRDSVGFLPPVLRGLMRLYADDLRRGVDAGSEYAAKLRVAAGSGGTQAIADALDAEVREVVLMIRSHKPFGAVFYRFGRLVGPLSELNVPLHHGPAGAPLLAQATAGFEELGEASATRFRILWGGWQDKLLREVSASHYFAETARRAGELYPILYGALVVDGKLVPISSFDFRSIPFGVASISNSRSVNTIVNVWCAIWREAGGDLTGRPF